MVMATATVFLILCLMIGVYAWRERARDTIIKKSDALMENHGLFIRKYGNDDDKVYHICKEIKGKVHYQVIKTSWLYTSAVEYSKTGMRFTPDMHERDCLYNQDNEIYMREVLIFLWSSVVNPDVFLDIKPKPKSTVKVDTLISDLVKAEMDGDKEKVELIFNQYLNDK